MFTKTKQSRIFHVNITKIPSTEHIPKALDELKIVIISEFIIEVFKVENMTCLYQITTEINLLTFYNNLKLNVDIEIIQKRYNPEKFPGMFLTLKKWGHLQSVLPSPVSPIFAARWRHQPVSKTCMLSTST